MIPPALNLRLQQLEENIIRILQLLNQYEAELIDEDDPGKKSKYRRRIENLKQQKSSYQEEFGELQIQLTDKFLPQSQVISSQLCELDNKIELLLDNQFSLSQALLSHFSSREQVLLSPFTEKLEKTELMKVQSFLMAVDNDRASEEEIQLMLDETRQLLNNFKRHNIIFPTDNEAILDMIQDPTIDTKHAFKISVPIIPFILSYEGEIGLGSGINLKKTWQNWASKFYNK